eukprot:Phypoly_transcript_07663.p1 GENE.Phypoly_transcript_07663~~Phypoly_transcript_07663.p1  ORF type:complete len:137 (+),score=29.28 Phypoly_transcript_07663:1141-1551(+)
MPTTTALTTTSLFATTASNPSSTYPTAYTPTPTFVTVVSPTPPLSKLKSTKSSLRTLPPSPTFTSSTIFPSTSKHLPFERREECYNAIHVFSPFHPPQFPNFPSFPFPSSSPQPPHQGPQLAPTNSPSIHFPPSKP